jgi:hypothetical protein
VHIQGGGVARRERRQYSFFGLFGTKLIGFPVDAWLYHIISPLHAVQEDKQLDSTYLTADILAQYIFIISNYIVESC